MNHEAPGWRLHDFAEVSSTSDVVRRLAEAGEPARLAVLAARQTAGRGTAGRAWDSRPGNLHLSLLLRPREPARNLPQWALLTAVAVHDALAPRVPAGRLSLKWPNDILLDGAKLAGILVEAEAGAEVGAEARWLCIGIGANLVHAPEVPDQPTARLPPPAPKASDVAGDVLRNLDRWDKVRLTEGFSAVRRAWVERGPENGTRLSVRGTHGPVAGLYEGLAEDGALLLRTGGRVHAFRAGEVAAG